MWLLHSVLDWVLIFLKLSKKMRKQNFFHDSRIFLSILFISKYLHNEKPFYNWQKTGNFRCLQKIWNLCVDYCQKHWPTSHNSFLLVIGRKKIINIYEILSIMNSGWNSEIQRSFGPLSFVIERIDCKCYITLHLVLSQRSSVQNFMGIEKEGKVKYFVYIRFLGPLYRYIPIQISTISNLAEY